MREWPPGTLRQSPVHAYSTARERHFQSVLLLGLRTFLAFAMPLVDRPHHTKVKALRVPCADYKRHSTKAFDWFATSGTECLSW